uniref:Palmitoyltransferase n=1 Tax=Macrostomum lignano TaxID=282301 RepID=A0A1I8J1Q9_9PLAT
MEDKSTLLDLDPDASAIQQGQQSPAVQLVHENDCSTTTSSDLQQPVGPRILVRTAAGWTARPGRQTRVDAAGRWIVRDGLGLVCLCLAWLVMLYAELITLCVILAPAPSATFRLLGGICFHILMGLALTAHLRAAFSDPGAVPLGSANHENLLRLGPMPDGRDRVVYRCARCDCVKPDRTHHCSVCGRCIRRMDHHCPWINNCVGLRNQKFFVLFTAYISLVSWFTVYLCLHYFAICLRSEWDACSGGPSPAMSTMLLLILIVLSLLFGIFTAVMAGSQISAILTNTTGIERIKGEQRTAQGLSCSDRLARVFGQPASWRWLSPLHRPHLRAEDDELLSPANDGFEKPSLDSVSPDLPVSRLTSLVALDQFALAKPDSSPPPPPPPTDFGPTCRR